jgi:hypothetical protein
MNEVISQFVKIYDEHNGKYCLTDLKFITDFLSNLKWMNVPTEDMLSNDSYVKGCVAIMRKYLSAYANDVDSEAVVVE